MEQLPLDLTPPRQPEQSAQHEETDLEQLDTEKLEQLYKKVVGINPAMRFLDKTEEERRKILIRDIGNPKEARRLLSEIDKADDHLDNPYRNQH